MRRRPVGVTLESFLEEPLGCCFVLLSRLAPSVSHIDDQDHRKADFSRQSSGGRSRALAHRHWADDHQCVESGVRDACDLGYLVTLVIDACTTSSAERHEQSLLGIRGYCRQRTTDALVAEIAAAG
jgi:hypothetical protein